MKTLRELQEQAPTKDELKFWMRVHEVGECWFYGIGDPSKYGTAWFDGANEPAHRVSYTVTKGPIPQGLLVRHACDTPRCVRPEHLSVGTARDNWADRMGTGNLGPILTLEDAKHIREDWIGGTSKDDLSKEWGVCVGTIERVIGGGLATYFNLEPLWSYEIRVPCSSMSDMSRAAKARGVSLNTIMVEAFELYIQKEGAK